jgi:hypothetical protein
MSCSIPNRPANSGTSISANKPGGHVDIIAQFNSDAHIEIMGLLPATFMDDIDDA